jgi:peptide/nickel transport system permease protein
MTALAAMGLRWLAPRQTPPRAIVIGLGVIFLLVLAASFADLLYPGDPLDMVGHPSLWPGVDPRFPLGTDSLGRDMAAEICHAARVSLLIGFAAASISVVVGVTVGLLAGYFGGLTDILLMR